MKLKSKIIHLFLINVFLCLGTIPVEARNIAALAENQRPNFKIENGFGWALFCEGDVENPCGFVEYTFVPEPPPILTPEFIELPLHTRVCKGDNCQCDFENRTTQECFEEATPFECQNISCVTALDAIYTLHPQEEINELFTDGAPFNATMTKHTPVLCGNITGGFFSAQTGCDPSTTDDDLTAANILLDYRCQVIAIFDAVSQFVDLSRSLAGTFVISVP